MVCSAAVQILRSWQPVRPSRRRAAGLPAETTSRIRRSLAATLSGSVEAAAGRGRAGGVWQGGGVRRAATGDASRVDVPISGISLMGVMDGMAMHKYM